jgi:hypothetical protein
MEAPGLAVREGQEFHWRAIWVTLLILLAFCMLGRMAISIRHFTVPIALLILLLASLPRLLARLRSAAPFVGRIASGLVTICALSSVFTAVHAYPFYMPYIDSLSFGRPAYSQRLERRLESGATGSEALCRTAEDRPPQNR